MLIDGFSAGAMFAQRYALLHPARVRAVAAGGCGALSLPISHINGTRLSWPAGVADFDALMGVPFDRETYRQIPQLFYIGEQDTANSTLDPPMGIEAGEVWSSLEQMELLRQTFGSPDPVRLERQVGYLQQLGYHKIGLDLRAGIGHNERPFIDTMLDFLSTHR